MVEVNVSKDGMTAEVSLKPESGEEMTAELVENTLRMEGVQAGIDKTAIAELVQKKIYDTFTTVARGKEPVNGKDAYYEYFFSTEADDGRPRIREDGTVDYTRPIVNVNSGDLLAEYFPETSGTFGFNVFAKALSPVRGKPQRPLRCINVRQTDEGRYYAEKSGHVSLSGTSLSVQNILEINGDAAYDGGDIDFNGDVHVKGNINSGISVRAAGSIMVEGVIEDAKVSAGQDIFVGGGIHGQGTRKDGVILKEGGTVVEAKGVLHAKFIDHAFVRADGNIVMDYSVGSVITSEGMITAQGTKGTIAGGNITALLGVDAGVLGNQAELPTEIKVGDSAEFSEKLSSARERLRDIEAKLAEYQKNAIPEELQAMTELARKQILELEQKERDRQIAPIIVRKSLHPRVKLQFGRLGLPDMRGRFNVEFRKIGGQILCKTIGTYTEDELTSCLIGTESQSVMDDKPTVLIIDDDTRLLRTVCRILGQDYQTAVATSGRVARKYLTNNTADLILLDYMMPEENGVEVLRSLREWDLTKDIPVVFLTGLSDKKKILECLSLHPAGYIMKPVDSDELLTKISAILSKK